MSESVDKEEGTSFNEEVLDVASKNENIEPSPYDSKTDNETDMCYNWPSYGFEKCLTHITGAFEEYSSKTIDNYTNGCKWAPDGTCLMTSSADNCLRIFNLPLELHCKATWESETLPEMKAVLKMKEGDLIYDYCWYPPMSSWYPETCCLISTSKGNPIHLWNAYTGILCGSYIPINDLDEVASAFSITFNHTGEKIYSGFCNLIRVFDTSRPGGISEKRVLKVSDSDYRCRQTGIVSCFAIHPLGEPTYAVGNYLKTIGIYAEPGGIHVAQLMGHAGGVSYLRFSPDGSKLYSGGRKDPKIHCWDMRNLDTPLYVMEREVNTNQRISFDITPDGRYLISGNTCGKVTVWDLNEMPVRWDLAEPLLKPVQNIMASKDCVNGVSIHQQYPILATSTGQWHIKEPNSDSEDEEDENTSTEDTIARTNTIPENNTEKTIPENNTGKSSAVIKTSSKPLLREINPELIDNSVKLWWIGS
ncbi:telomerase Cajal body protein 1 [Hetaerina americana]|uniref:telomerase Cajal body protein 1 n=1 Tax=Hetaerina americana TaxID=62018 RepID=UPI003A7F1704